MTQRGWVALLRGVNLGARNKVPMAELRALLEEVGCESVRTYIQSGNALFSHPSSGRAALARKLERAVEERFAIATAVVLRTFGEMRVVVDSHPFGDDGSQTHVAFLAAKPRAAAVRNVERLDLAPDRVKVTGSDVFLHYANGVQGARLGGAQLERHLGVPATLRNWRTVSRLAELADPDAAA